MAGRVLSHEGYLMKFEVIGFDRDTQSPVEMSLEADSEQQAREVLERKNVQIARLRPAEIVRVEPARETPPALPRQPHQQGHIRGAPVINVALPRRGNSFGIVSLVAGILAILLCWIPLLNVLSVPLFAIGLLFAFVGLIVAMTRGGAGIGFAIAGGAFSLLAAVLFFTINTAFVNAMNRVAQPAGSASPAQTSPAPAAAP